jgi:hypothetical protein
MKKYFYFILALFSISAGCVIYNPERVGILSLIVYKSYNNIFHRVKFEDIRHKLRHRASKHISFRNEHWNGFEIIEDAFMFEEIYWCKYSYINSLGVRVVNIDKAEVLWKTWEYYYLEFDKDFKTEEHLRGEALRNEWLQLKYSKLTSPFFIIK